MNAAFLNMHSILSAVSKALAKGANQVLLAHHPIGAVVSSEVIDFGADLLMEQLPPQRDDIHQMMPALCEDMLPPGSEEYLAIICAAAEICLEDLDLLEEGFDAKETARSLSRRYIQRYQAHFSSADLHQLQRILPALLEKTISALMVQSEQDPEFQVAWKALTLQRMDRLERQQLACTEQLLDHEAQLADHEARISTQERHAWRLCTVAELSEKYRRKWDEPLFLDDSIILKQVYQLPFSQHDLSYNQIDTDSLLQSVIPSPNTADSNMLVVLGHPGSGKSTLITYLLNCCKISKPVAVRVHRFTGFEGINWNGDPENLPQILLNALGLDIDYLHDLLLILDGLDEIDMLEGHDAFLDCLYEQCVMRMTAVRFTLIITCRTNRIPDPNELMADHIVLSPLTGQQIQRFAKAYWSGTNTPANPKMTALFQRLEDHEQDLRDILGIPLILYITLALGITVTSGVGLCDVYDQIFSLHNANSIYLRSRYDRMHPVTAEEAERIHEFSKRIAGKIWELNPTEAAVEKSVYEPLAAELAGSGKGRLRKLLIGQYFMEGQHATQLLFVHRSLYEYFTALSIFDSIKALVCGKQSLDLLYARLESGAIPPVLTALADLIGVQCLFEYPDIQGYLLNMLRRKPFRTAGWWRKLFLFFTQRGLADAAAGRPKGGVIGIQEELNRFYNLIWLVREELRLLGCPAPFDLGNSDDTPIYFRIPSSSVKDLSNLCLPNIELPGGSFEHGVFNGSNLEGARLIGASLSGAQFVGARLDSAFLCHTDLRGANLQDADLSDADLQGADLSNANLLNADLSGANLRDANLTNACLQGANLTGAILEDVCFDGASFPDADLSNVSLRGTVLHNINFSGAELYGTDLAYADMTGSILCKANLTQADLSHAKLDLVDMRQAALYSTKMRHASLAGAFLCSVDLKHADLQNADLSGAGLRHAHLLHINLQSADLSNADLRGVVFSHVDLREAELIYADFGGAVIKRTDMTLGAIDKALYSDQDIRAWDIAWDEPCQLKTGFLPYSETDAVPLWDLDAAPLSSYWDMRRTLKRLYQNPEL